MIHNIALHVLRPKSSSSDRANCYVPKAVREGRGSLAANSALAEEERGPPVMSSAVYHMSCCKLSATCSEVGVRGGRGRQSRRAHHDELCRARVRGANDHREARHDRHAHPSTSWQHGRSKRHLPQRHMTQHNSDTRRVKLPRRSHVWT